MRPSRLCALEFGYASDNARVDSFDVAHAAFDDADEPVVHGKHNRVVAKTAFEATELDCLGLLGLCCHCLSFRVG